MPVCYLDQISPTSHLSMRHLFCNSSKLGLILKIWELVSEGSLTGSYPVFTSNVIMYLTTN